MCSRVIVYDSNKQIDNSLRIPDHLGYSTYFYQVDPSDKYPQKHNLTTLYEYLTQI